VKTAAGHVQVCACDDEVIPTFIWYEAVSLRENDFSDFPVPKNTWTSAIVIEI
jgi:hypothetical protein